MQQTKKILTVVGTRPNFIKITQFNRTFSAHSTIDHRIVHTGQHYDQKMSQVFFDQFGIVPDFFLNVQANSQLGHLHMIMAALEDLINNKFRPDILLCVGDVTSTLAAALVANKMDIKLGHIESGLRSCDERMPEEINRILTDRITDIHFITEGSGEINLQKEGLDHNYHFVGNTMIDTLVAYRNKINESKVLELLGVQSKEFLLVTLHRPGLVDDKKEFERSLTTLVEVSEKVKVIFPIHPRSKQKMTSFGLDKLVEKSNIIFAEPLDYFSFQKLIKESVGVLTDSGGIQEETTFLQIPCLTLRPNTERPITITEGSNKLITNNHEEILSEVELILDGMGKSGQIPKLWDGKSSERIAEVIANWN